MGLAFYGIIILVRHDLDENYFFGRGPRCCCFLCSTQIPVHSSNLTVRTFGFVSLVCWFCVQGVFLGIYGGSLVDSNSKSLERHKKKMKKELMQNMEANATISTANDGDATQTDKDDDDQIGLFQDVFGVILLEIPIVSVVVGFGLVIGHFEGWGIIERYDTVTFVIQRKWTMRDKIHFVSNLLFFANHTHSNMIHRSLYWTVISGSTIGFGYVVSETKSTILLIAMYKVVSVFVISHIPPQPRPYVRQRRQSKGTGRPHRISVLLAPCRGRRGGGARARGWSLPGSETTHDRKKFLATVPDPHRH